VPGPPEAFTPVSLLSSTPFFSSRFQSTYFFLLLIFYLTSPCSFPFYIDSSAFTL
jgi:hypothetical protein